MEVGAGQAGSLATFGAGCYWGTEHYFRTKFTKLFPDSIVDVKVRIEAWGRLSVSCKRGEMRRARELAGGIRGAKGDVTFA